MLRKILAGCGVIMLILSAFLPGMAPAASAQRAANAARGGLPAAPTFPVVDPNYIYQQLYSLVTRFPHREAGYDTNLPPSVNGHDEFAAAWADEMTHDLAGFGPQVRQDTFHISGWSGRPATTPAFNVEVTVPGVTDPAHEVVIGCHYDGMAFSTQSANDDGSGCAIELGVAKALGDYWRANHLYPARTLRFVIFDAEEQGIFGSFHYVNDTVNGDLNTIVAMFNEEQSGIAYPLRYLGRAANPLLPFYAYLTPLTNSQNYPAQNQLSPAQQQSITQFRSLMAQAVPPVFAAFQALGYQTLTYHGSNGADVSQPVFSTDQTGNIKVGDDTIGSSDQFAFTLAGLPCVTFAGNSTYYDDNPPPWSYPYDQPEDTIQLMNTFANGSAQQSQALTLALALPGMFTTWMLSQPGVLGQVSWDHRPIAAISDIGQAQPGKPLTLDAKAAYNPANPSAAFTYAWDFGDGATASGVSVTHTYAASGDYTLTLSVTSASGTRKISKLVTVTNQPPNYANPYGNFQSDGMPPGNPQVQLPSLNGSQPPATQSNSSTSGNFAQTLTIVVFGIAGLALLALIIVLLVLFLSSRSRRRMAS